jgi:hypothetical protein
MRSALTARIRLPAGSGNLVVFLWLVPEEVTTPDVCEAVLVDLNHDNLLNAGDALLRMMETGFWQQPCNYRLSAGEMQPGKFPGDLLLPAQACCTMLGAPAAKSSRRANQGRNTYQIDICFHYYRACRIYVC